MTVLPSIFSEISGVHHTKLLVFDNTSILTGANLSHDYFTNRQDRYHVIQNCEPLSDYIEDFVNSLCSVSSFIDNDGQLRNHNNYPDINKNKLKFKEALLQQLKMFRFSNRVKIPLGEDLTADKYFKDLKSYNGYAPKTDSTVSDELKLIEFTMKSRENFETILPESLQHMKSQINFKENKSLKNNTESNKVLIFPTFQFGPFQENDDKEVLTGLINDLDIKKLTVSSGYFNFPSFFIELLKRKNYPIEIITSSPECNGFYKGGLFKKYIPNLYRAFELKFLQNVRDNKNISLYEFKRDLWTFHSKGMWIYENEEYNPNFTVIGSSNFNQRSFNNDFEMQFYLYSFCENFNSKLEMEVRDHFYDCYQVDSDLILRDKENRTSRKLRFFSRYFKKFM